MSIPVCFGQPLTQSQKDTLDFAATVLQVRAKDVPLTQVLQYVRKLAPHIWSGDIDEAQVQAYFRDKENTAPQSCAEALCPDSPQPPPKKQKLRPEKPPLDKSPLQGSAVPTSLALRAFPLFAIVRASRKYNMATREAYTAAAHLARLAGDAELAGALANYDAPLHEAYFKLASRHYKDWTAQAESGPLGYASIAPELRLAVEGDGGKEKSWWPAVVDYSRSMNPTNEG